MRLKQLIKASSGRLSLTPPLKQGLFGNTGSILMLHRVVPDETAAALPHREPLCVGKSSFENLLLWLKQHFDCVPLAELFALNGTSDRRPRVALTFDDGWRDNAVHAFPLLRQHQVPASIFLSTDFIGSARRFWWEAIGETLWGSFGAEARERLAATLRQLQLVPPAELAAEQPDEQRSKALAGFLQRLKRLPADQLQALADGCPEPAEPHALDWQQVAEMEASGLVRFGPHGASHAILTELDESSLEAEVQRSRETLDRHCAAPLPIYCYPNGDHDAHVHAALRRQGYRLALSTRPGLVRNRPTEDLALPRIGVSHQSARQPGLLAWRLLQGVRQ